MSNLDIQEKCKELNINNFKGVFMRDELNNNKVTNNECLIINTDHSSNNGTHWTCLFIKNRICYYFDSYGLPPPLEVLKYSENYSANRCYNSFEIQKSNQVICGHFCIFVLYKLNTGHNFHDILIELYNFNI